MHLFAYPTFVLIVIVLNKKTKFINIVRYYIYKSFYDKKKTSTKLPIYNSSFYNKTTSKGPPIGKVISTDDLKVLN
jgi:hypothetical protein